MATRMAECLECPARPVCIRMTIGGDCREVAKLVEAKVTSTNTGSPKLFLLQVQDVIECRECSDADKVAGIKVLVTEQLRAGA